MISFFIIDKNLISKQKIEESLRKSKFSEILLRNREEGKFQNELKLKKYYSTFNLNNPSKIKLKGIHVSLFYNKLLSEIPFLKDVKITVSAHNLKDIIICQKYLKPQYVFISPVFATKTHPNTKSLSVVQLFNYINSTKNRNFILLGGMNEERYKKIKRFDFKNKIRGFAGVNGF